MAVTGGLTCHADAQADVCCAGTSRGLDGSLASMAGRRFVKCARFCSLSTARACGVGVGVRRRVPVGRRRVLTLLSAPTGRGAVDRASLTVLMHAVPSFSERGSCQREEKREGGRARKQVVSPTALKTGGGNGWVGTFRHMRASCRPVPRLPRRNLAGAACRPRARRCRAGRL